jgi:hypothetical protein
MQKSSGFKENLKLTNFLTERAETEPHQPKTLKKQWELKIPPAPRSTRHSFQNKENMRPTSMSRDSNDPAREQKQRRPPKPKALVKIDSQAQLPRLDDLVLDGLVKLSESVLAQAKALQRQVAQKSDVETKFTTLQSTLNSLQSYLQARVARTLGEKGFQVQKDESSCFVKEHFVKQNGELDHLIQKMSLTLEKVNEIEEI